MDNSTAVALVGVPFVVVWAITLAIARGRRNPFLLGAASLTFVVAGWVALIGLLLAGIRCSDSCESPGSGYGWRELSGAWQWGAQALLAFVCFAIAWYILYEVTLGKPRRVLRGLAVATIPVAGLVLLGLSGHEQPYSPYPQPQSVPSGSPIKDLYLGYQHLGGQREVYFVATGPSATHLDQGKECVREQRKMAKSAFCYAYPSEEALQVEINDEAAGKWHPCWTARWGVDFQGNEGR